MKIVSIGMGRKMKKFWRGQSTALKNCFTRPQKIGGKKRSKMQTRLLMGFSKLRDLLHDYEPRKSFRTQINYRLGLRRAIACSQYPYSLVNYHRILLHPNPKVEINS